MQRSQRMEFTWSVYVTNNSNSFNFKKFFCDTFILGPPPLYHNSFSFLYIFLSLILFDVIFLYGSLLLQNLNYLPLFASVNSAYSSESSIKGFYFPSAGNGFDAMQPQNLSLIKHAVDVKTFVFNVLNRPIKPSIVYSLIWPLPVPKQIEESWLTIESCKKINKQK